MRIDWWTLGLQTINLLVLLAILARFLFRPLTRIVAERQAEAAKLVDDVQAQQEQAQAALREIEAQRRTLVQERERFLAAAHKEAEAQRASLIDAARQEAARQRAEAAEGIGRMRDDEEARIGRRANSVAAEIAARLLEGPAAHLPLDSFLESLERALSALPPTSRDAIGTDAVPVSLLSAQPLNVAQLAACRAALARALAREVPLTLGVEPALIAGLRLTTESVFVDANLRANLERVRAALDTAAHE
jgi:F-type H+-transporting ATPase subunit b